MKKYRLATVFLIAIMVTGILTVTSPLISLTSADPWSPGKGPPIVIEDTGLELYPPPMRIGTMNGSISEWEPIKPLNNETYRANPYDKVGNDTESWSWDGTTKNASLIGTGLWEGYPGAPPVEVFDMARDLKALYMWLDPSDKIYIRLDLANLFVGFGPGPGLTNTSMYAIYFSTNLSMPGGTFSLDPNFMLMTFTDPPGRVVGFLDGLFMNDTCAWEYMLFFSETVAVLVKNRMIANNTLHFFDFDTWGGYNGTTGNIHMAIDYDNNAIELSLPRADFLPSPLTTVCLAAVSYKVGIWANGTLSPGLNKTKWGIPIELATPHPFDPQAVKSGIMPPYAGEENAQPGANGPDHADIMAPATVGASHPLVTGFHMVENQKFVEMSPSAKLHIYDAVTGQENITDDYSYNEQFTVNIDIVDAQYITGVSMSIKWNPAVLECLSWTWQFGVGTLLGPSGNWIGPDGTIDPTGRIYPAGSKAWIGTGDPPSGSGTLVQAVFNVTAAFDGSWICFRKADVYIELNVTRGAVDYGRKTIVEFPMKNAWYYKSPPTPGPPVLKYTQTPPPPHYPNDTIQFDLCTSEPGFNGTHYVPIENYSIWVWNSTGDLLYHYLGPEHLLNFTPQYADTYTFTLDIHLDPTFDPGYPSEWLQVNETFTKVVIEKALTGIDCYTGIHRYSGYTTPYIGKGWNMSADAYALDEVVEVYSYVFYNNWPKQSFLVSFEVYDAAGNLTLVRTALTNGSGVAHISFRILTVCLDPEYAFGKWRIFQKVLMSDEYYNDTLWFDVGWLVELLTVEPGKDIYYVGDPYGEHMAFNVTWKTISQIPRDVVFVVTVYDDEDVPIAVRTLNTTVDPGRYCDPEYDFIVIDCMLIPKWTYPGLAKVYVNAWFNGLPTECGHPTSPEISATFIIQAPP